MDHSENDKRFCVYVHKDIDGNIRYIGSGTKQRVISNSRRSLEHKELWGSLTKEILYDNLSRRCAAEIEQDLINKYWDSGLLFNAKRNHTLPKPISFEEVSKYLEYDETSPSCIRWKEGTQQGSTVGGDVAGHLSASSGYWVCCINYRTYKVQRLVWVLQSKEDLYSNLFVDHIDRNKSNNKIDNLRLVTQQDNVKNTDRVENQKSLFLRWNKIRKFFYLEVYLGDKSTSFVSKVFTPSILFPDDNEKEAKDKTLVLANQMFEIINTAKESSDNGCVSKEWLKTIVFPLIQRNVPFEGNSLILTLERKS